MPKNPSAPRTTNASNKSSAPRLRARARRMRFGLASSGAVGGSSLTAAAWSPPGRRPNEEGGRWPCLETQLISVRAGRAVPADGAESDSEAHRNQNEQRQAAYAQSLIEHVPPCSVTHPCE